MHVRRRHRRRAAVALSAAAFATAAARANAGGRCRQGIRGNGEGGIVPEEYAVEYVVDRVDTTSTVWLGLTVGCARCHDHKYDPISQKEFYQFFAYFNNVPERGMAFKYGNSPPFIQAPTPPEQSQLREMERKVSASANRSCERATRLLALPAATKPTLRRVEPSSES